MKSLRLHIGRLLLWFIKPAQTERFMSGIQAQAMGSPVPGRTSSKPPEVSK